MGLLTAAACSTKVADAVRRKAWERFAFGFEGWRNVRQAARYLLHEQRYRRSREAAVAFAAERPEVYGPDPEAAVAALEGGA